MAKSRKKARKAAKRPGKKRVAKRKAAAKAKPRKAAKKSKPRKVKPRKETSIVDVMTGAAGDARELRARLAGHNTFED